MLLSRHHALCALWKKTRLAAHKLVAASKRYLAIFARTVAGVTHAGIMQQLSNRSGGLSIQLFNDKLAVSPPMSNPLAPRCRIDPQCLGAVLETINKTRIPPAAIRNSQESEQTASTEASQASCQRLWKVWTQASCFDCIGQRMHPENLLALIGAS